MVLTLKWSKHAFLPGTYFFSYALNSLLNGSVPKPCIFPESVKPSIHPVIGVNSAFSFKALTSVFCLNVCMWIGMPWPLMSTDSVFLCLEVFNLSLPSGIVTHCWNMFFLFSQMLFSEDTGMLSCFTTFCACHVWTSIHLLNDLQFLRKW